MATKLQWSKSGLRLNFDVSAQPTPRIQQAYPFPDIPIQEAQLLGVALETIAQTSRSGIRVRSLGTAELPGTAGAVFSLKHVTVQGAITVEEEIAVPGRTINILVEQAIPGALHSFALKRTDAGQVTVWPAVSINTPADPTLGNITALQAAIASFGSDGVLTVGEKASAITTYSGLLSQVTTLRSQCASVGGTAPAQNTLLPYLQSLGPWPWNDVQPGHDTTIPVPATWIAKWGEIYTEIGALTSAIAAKLSSDTGTKLPIAGTAANALLLAGYAPDTAGSPNTIVRRDSAGGIAATTGSFNGQLRVSTPYVGSAPSASSTPIARINNGGALSLWIGGQSYTNMWIQSIQDDGTNYIKDLLIQPMGGMTSFGGAINGPGAVFSGGVQGSEMSVSKSGTITRLNLFTDNAYSCNIYNYVNGQPRVVLVTDATNWSIGTWNASGVWNDNPIVIPISGGNISVNRGLVAPFVAASSTASGYGQLRVNNPWSGGEASMSFSNNNSGPGSAGASPGGNVWGLGLGVNGIAPHFGLFNGALGANSLVINQSNHAAFFTGNVYAPNVVNGDNATKTRNLPNGAASFSDPLPSGFYDCSGATDMPTTTWYHCITSAHTGSYAGNQYMLQLAAPFWGRNKLYFRTLDSGNVTGGWQEIYHAGNIDTAPASLQAIKSLVTAPQVGPFASRPAASSYPKGYYYATDVTGPDGQLGALYYSDGSSWSAPQNPQTIAGRVICGTLSAGSGGFTAIAAYMAMTGTLQSLPYTSGAAGTVPSGFRFSGNLFLSTFFDGTQDYVQGEIGGNVNMGGYRIDGLALAKIAGSGGVTMGPGTYAWVCPRNVTEVTLTLVGAGASGGSNNGGRGGGAGGILKIRVAVTPLQTYSIVVGSGGHSVINAVGVDGGATTGLGYTAYGGSSSGAGGGISGPSGSLSGPLTGGSTAKISLNYLFACAGGAGGHDPSGLPAGSTEFYSGGGVGGGGASAAGSGGVQASSGVTEAQPGTGFGSGGGYARYAGWSSGAGASGYARIDY